MDVALSVCIIVTVLPLLLLIALLVVATSRGGVIFSHKRIGFGGREFKCYKFRSMVRDGEAVLQAHLASNPDAASEWKSTQKLKKDPRITTVGRILRTSSLDELPQLFNVVRGDMSLVGPRPIVTSEIQRFGSEYRRYVRARPGITGPWQVGGRSDCTYSQRVAFDSEYVRNWSVRRDFVLLAVTAKAVLERKGSY